MRIRRYTDEQIKAYCRKRNNVAKKYKYVNFWTFVQLNLINGMFTDESNKRTHTLRNPVQDI